MKRLTFLLIATVFLNSSNAQNLTIGSSELFSTAAESDNSESLKKIAHKKYLTQSYKPAKVDNLEGSAYLRYNIYQDEMEFVKDEQIYYLKKEQGRKVYFPQQKITYQVYEMNGNLKYFIVQNEGKNILLTRQIVKFVEAREPQSSYQKGTPADYKRKNDEHFLALNNAAIIKLPSNKKSFYTSFESKSSEIKAYMKKNNLSYTKLDDLRKVIEYYNTL